MMIFLHHRRDTHQVASMEINAVPNDAFKGPLPTAAVYSPTSDTDPF